MERTNTKLFGFTPTSQTEGHGRPEGLKLTNEDQLLGLLYSFDLDLDDI